MCTGQSAISLTLQRLHQTVYLRFASQRSNLIDVSGLMENSKGFSTTAICPFSSVVERATRNGEVGCSIQPVGSLFIRTSDSIIVVSRSLLGVVVGL